MNDLMSGGVHRLWKTAMVDWLNPRPGLKLLDTSGGTGDIAFRVLARLETGAGEVIVCDPPAAMVAVGRDRAIDPAMVEGPAGGCRADASMAPTAGHLPARTTDFGHTRIAARGKDV